MPIFPRPQQPAPASRKQLLRALEGAQLHVNEVCANLLITTMVAHWRAGNISKAKAAMICQMTEDNFSRAVHTVGQEAERMIMEHGRMMGVATASVEEKK